MASLCIWGVDQFTKKVKNEKLRDVMTELTKNKY